MKILLLVPPTDTKTVTTKYQLAFLNFTAPPLGLGYIAAVLEENGFTNIQIVDAHALVISFETYRKIQLARYLIINKLTKINDFRFDKEGNIIDFGISLDVLLKIIRSGNPFLTSGCSGCNRPYYNERPGKEPYNYPRPLSSKEVSKIEKLFQSVLGRLHDG